MFRPSVRLLGAALILGSAAVLPGQDSASEKAMMEAWQKASTPGEPHKKLDALVGTFDAKVRSTVDPSKPPEDSTGTSVNTWVLGGRYVQQEFDGSFMGEPFNGIGYTGYDNVQKKYLSVWMDTAGTGMMWITAMADKTGKTMSGSARIWDPMTQKPATVESKITVVDNDHHNFELWGKAPNGKQIKLMEIQYTRKK
jgi:Protein of unknown function (DUF1579)